MPKKDHVARLRRPVMYNPGKKNT